MWEEEGEVGGEACHEVDNPEEAEDIGFGFADGDDAEDVFDREGDGEGPFEGIEQGAVFFVDGLDAFEHDGGDAERDDPEENDIEAFSGGGIGFEDDLVEAAAPGGPVGIAFESVFRVGVLRHRGLLYQGAGAQGNARDRWGLGRVFIAGRGRVGYRLWGKLCCIFPIRRINFILRGRTGRSFGWGAG